MNRMRALLAGVGLSLVLAGCAPSGYRTPNEVSMAFYRRSVGLDRQTTFGAEARAFHWVGVTRTAEGWQDLAVVYTLRANDLEGRYYLGAENDVYGVAGRGDVRGSVVNDVVRLEVSRSRDCAWQFTGVIVGHRLQGKGDPTFCPGAESFEWDVRLDTP
jgi:hypothetical protein